LGNGLSNSPEKRALSALSVSASSRTRHRSPRPPRSLGGSRAYWGRGYATEAARAALDYGFGKLGLSEIGALTVPANQRSRRVMERLGMTRAPEDDFDHPRVPEGPLKRHVLYRLRNTSAASRVSSR
jgi:RimJ/RimL family protein N-acetyltransferase